VRRFAAVRNSFRTLRRRSARRFGPRISASPFGPITYGGRGRRSWAEFDLPHPIWVAPVARRWIWRDAPPALQKNAPAEMPARGGRGSFASTARPSTTHRISSPKRSCPADTSAFALRSVKRPASDSAHPGTHTNQGRHEQDEDQAVPPHASSLLRARERPRAFATRRAARTSHERASPRPGCGELLEAARVGEKRRRDWSKVCAHACAFIAAAHHGFGRVTGRSAR
jgi:hypothetical protein